MTLYEMSFTYQQSGQAIAERIHQLQQSCVGADRETQRTVEQRIAELRRMLYETRELMILTRRYYDRSYHKNGKYTL